MKKCIRIVLGLLLFLVPPVSAGEADVVDVEVKSLRPGLFDFTVTVRHHDEGWHHFVDHWQVRSPEGRLLATRSIHHPHVTEQPFTRLLFGVSIEEEIPWVEIRAHDSVHGYGGETVRMPLPR